MQTRVLFPLYVTLAMVSCNSMNGPVSSGSFDPLQTPGSEMPGNSSDITDQIRPGQFVVATIDNTAFFNERPSGEAEADQLLSRGTSMKVISTSGTFFRVELDSGQVGFVPSIMVENPNAMADDSDEPFDLYPEGFNIEPITPLPEGSPVEPLPESMHDPLPEPIEPAPDTVTAPASDAESTPAPATETTPPAPPTLEDN